MEKTLALILISLLAVGCASKPPSPSTSSSPEAEIEGISRSLADLDAMINSSATEPKVSELYGMRPSGDRVLIKTYPGDLKYIKPVNEKAGEYELVFSDGRREAAPELTGFDSLAITEVWPGFSIENKAEKLYKEITEKARKMYDEYKNNEYIEVKGFTVEISVPPSVSVDFEFK